MVIPFSHHHHTTTTTTTTTTTPEAMVDIPLILVSPYVLGPPLGYVALVLACRALGPRRLAPLLRLRLAHNLLLACSSFLVGWATVQKLRDRYGVYETVCVASAGAAPYWYASKLWEWFDTVLIYARGRKPSALHLGHHATTASVVALNLLGRERPTPLFDVGTALNATVHTYMYLYYSDPLTFGPFRRAITRAQIAQHVIVVVSLASALATPGCDAPLAPYAASLAAYGFYLLAFLGFYTNAYRRAPSASHQKGC